MITQYHRPETIEDALRLLRRKQAATRALGGGTVLAAPSPDSFEVVDLQDLKLDRIGARGKNLHIGATATLESLYNHEAVPAALKNAIHHEASHNIRQAASVAGALVSADGRSPFATAMLALDAQLELQPKDETLGYGDLLAIGSRGLTGKLITKVVISTAVQLSYHYVARTPADLPIVALALARWTSGRTRLALGGWGSAPVLTMDGRESSGVIEAVENALSEAGDQWASSEYRQQAGRKLAERALAEVSA
jgi:probable selenate reductase FAD-binding subunit